MNATFEVADLGAVFNPEQTHTRQLPSIPTGKVWSAASKSLSGMGTLLSVGLVGLVVLINV
jgi:hypothetical protein